MYAEFVSYESWMYTIVAIKSSTAVYTRSLESFCESFYTIISLDSRGFPIVSFKSLHVSFMSCQMPFILCFKPPEFSVWSLMSIVTFVIVMSC